jgi:hypothetical protein
LILSFFSGCQKTYTRNRYKDNVTCFGWEGDKNAPWIYMDGSFYITDRKINIDFGVTDIPGTISWQLEKKYLPCFRSEFAKNGVEYSIITFADKIKVNDNNFVAAYSSFTIVNNSDKDMEFPKVSAELTSLDKVPETIKKGKTVCIHYAVYVDKFGGKYSYPSAETLKTSGTYDAHYNHMQNYWLNRVKGIVNIEALPYEELVDAYKAGYIYTLIVKDGNELHVGENGYDRVFDHDTISIISTLVLMGDTDNFEKYASHILDNVQYKDARWKYSLPYALYLQKTGDTNLVIRHFKEIKNNTEYIEKERTSSGCMVSTNAIDADGFWTVDDWSALAGLSSYKYISDYLYSTTKDKLYSAESLWAKNLYNDLFSSVEKIISKTMSSKKLNYIPVSLVQANTENRCKKANDANWASMFLFGSWAWQGYLFGAPQDGTMLSHIDSTYSYGFSRLSDKGFEKNTFGGFTGVCSAYNAGYGSAALRGEKYRDIGINAYIYMLENSQSAPYSWWENANSFGKDNTLNGYRYVNSGWGSCPHMWGQALATNVLLDSLICEKSDGTLIIGRGVPASWIQDGKHIKIDNYPTSSGKVGYSVTVSGNKVNIKIAGNHSAVSIEMLRFKNNITGVSCGKFDNKMGIVKLDKTQDSVIITLKNRG